MSDDNVTELTNNESESELAEWRKEDREERAEKRCVVCGAFSPFGPLCITHKNL